MLAATEDLLDSWPGTLIVVSHDRYFVERVTDQQYAVLDGRLRHLPGGVDEYLRLRAEVPAAAATRAAPGAPAAPRGSSAAERDARRERNATERSLDRLTAQIASLHEQLAAHDPSDYLGLARLGDELREAEARTAALEDRWLELSEQLDP